MTGCESQQNFEEQGIKLLKKGGYRITSARKNILKILASIESVFSTQDLCEKVKELSSSQVDQVTVYRVLSLYRDMGLVHQVPGSQSYKVCQHLECESLTHIISSCSSCQKTHEMHLPSDLAKQLSQFLNESPFGGLNQTLHMLGVCRDCEQASAGVNQ